MKITKYAFFKTKDVIILFNKNKWNFFKKSKEDDVKPKKLTFKVPLDESEIIIPDIFLLGKDSQFLLELKELIENFDYNVVGIETNPVNAIEIIEEIVPYIILLDTNLGKYAIEVTNIAEKLNIPVIFLSEAIGDEITEKILLTAPYGFLIKPFSQNELRRAIDVALKKHDSNLENILNTINTIKRKNSELVIEKLSAVILLLGSIFLISFGIYTRDVTWLQWLLFLVFSFTFFLALVSLYKEKEPTPYEIPPFVSLIIPAHNEEHTIEATTRSIANVDYNLNGKPNFEIIVVNDGSDDNTGEILHKLKKEIPTLRIISRFPPLSGKGKGFVLNDALALSKGEVIGVFDADTRIKEDFLNKIIPYLNDSKVQGVQSRVKMYNKNKNFLARMQHVEFGNFGNILRSKDILGNSGFLGGNGQFVKKSAIIQADGWDGFAVTEDLNLAIKLIINGDGIRYCGEAAIYQEAVTTWKALFKQRARWATGNFETLFIYFSDIFSAKIPPFKKFLTIEHISVYAVNLFVFFGFIVFLVNIIAWFVFNQATLIHMDAPVIIGIIAFLAFFPQSIISLTRDKTTPLIFIKDLLGYWLYCFHLIPLFFQTMYIMITRKKRDWSKTDHSGGEKQK